MSEIRAEASRIIQLFVDTYPGDADVRVFRNAIKK